MNFALPIPVRRALRKLGGDIQSARKRRRIGTQLMAERVGISRTTVHKIDKGDPGVAFSHYATVLFVLGMVERLANLADVSTDNLGMDLEEENLPKRIRVKKQTS